MLESQTVILIRDYQFEFQRIFNSSSGGIEMARPKLTLHPSEAVVAQSAAYIYAAYLSSGRVPEGKEQQWMQRSIREAYQIARMTDDAIQSDSEMS